MENQLLVMATNIDHRLEKSVLGQILCEADSIERVYEVLKPECFHDAKNKVTYQAIREMYEVGTPIDLLTVLKKLEAMGKKDLIGGERYISSLVDTVVSTAHLEAHTQMLNEYHIKRELSKFSSDLGVACAKADADAFSLVSEYQYRIETLTDGVVPNKITTMSSFAKNALIGLKKPDTLRVKTHIRSLDNAVGASVGGHFNVIAAQTGMGKTAFATFLARTIAIRDNRDVAIISMEMGGDMLSVRQMITEFHYLNLGNEGYGFPTTQKFLNNELEDNEYEGLELAVSMSEHMARTHVVEGKRFTVSELISVIRKLHRERGVKIFFIDYLQLIKLGNVVNKADALSNACYDLKDLAKELDIVIFGLSQITRDVHKRANKRPTMSDLSDSSGLEKVSDFVIFLYRPFVNGELNDEEGNYTENSLEIIVGKARFGNTQKTHRLFIDNEKHTIYDWEYTSTSSTPNIVLTKNVLDIPNI